MWTYDHWPHRQFKGKATQITPVYTNPAPWVSAEPHGSSTAVWKHSPQKKKSLETIIRSHRSALWPSRTATGLTPKTKAWCHGGTRGPGLNKQGQAAESETAGRATTVIVARNQKKIPMLNERRLNANQAICCHLSQLTSLYTNISQQMCVRNCCSLNLCSL